MTRRRLSSPRPAFATPARTKIRDRQTKSAVACELGQKIDRHLKRIERDPKLNPGRRFDKEKDAWIPDEMGVRDYYGANAHGDRHRVRISYITYQAASFLPIEDAEKYLAWLDAGNVGSHHEAIKVKKAKKESP